MTHSAWTSEQLRSCGGRKMTKINIQFDLLQKNKVFMGVIDC